ncbi:hypothetical protein V5O48_002729 [Marasmius crinis-equi]|uniref:Nitronate monooxygenase domain-containing protein n=1 Tax=Marasmius crinis-equi TaxID=585013 RepID=A0ABR3FUU3_9AGAR
MPQVSTPLTRLLQINTPIIAPPMALAHGGVLAANAYLGGGFGFIAAGYRSKEWLQSELDNARGLLSPSRSLPVGVGYFGWELDKQGKEGEKMIEVALENDIRAVWLSFGDNLEKYVKFVREHPRGKDTAVFVLISTVDEGRAVVQDWKVKPDVLVCQGNESGGHGRSASPPLSTLLPTILALLQSSQSKMIPVAAGGLAHSSHIASALTAGASGVVMGTRFLLTPESFYPPHFQERLLKAKAEDTVRTEAFDRARGTTEWPVGVDGRGLINETVRDFDKGISEDELVEKYKQAAEKKDPSRLVVWSGTGIGMIGEGGLRPTKDLIRELNDGCVRYLRDAAKLLED